MPNIEIYTTATCPYCYRAKAVFIRKHLPFQEISIDGDLELQKEMIKRCGHITVPQIFIDGKHVGGGDALHALNVRGDLDPLLQ